MQDHITSTIIGFAMALPLSVIISSYGVWMVTGAFQ